MEWGLVLGGSLLTLVGVLAFRSRSRDSGKGRDVPSGLGALTGPSDTTIQPGLSDAHPLKQITVRIQGTRYSTNRDLVRQLQVVAARLQAGDIHGEEHSNDFGYSFIVIDVKSGPSFFDTSKHSA